MRVFAIALAFSAVVAVGVTYAQAPTPTSQAPARRTTGAGALTAGPRGTSPDAGSCASTGTRRPQRPRRRRRPSPAFRTA